MIEGVVVTPLRQIEDTRGKVMHMLRRDAPVFTEFGEIYFSTANRGAVKGWNRHRRMTRTMLPACRRGQRYMCPPMTMAVTRLRANWSPPLPSTLPCAAMMHGRATWWSTCRVPALL